MAAAQGSEIYSKMLGLYPAAFRDEYRGELVQLADDLLTDRGLRAWPVLLTDLAVSVPRTRMESVMRFAPTPTQLTVILTTMSLASFLLVINAEIGAVGDALAIVIGVLAIGLALMQRSTLARVLDRPDVGAATTLSSVLRQAWWAPLAAFHGLATLWLATQITTDSTGDTLLGIAVTVAFALSLLGGLGLRLTRPAIGSSMIMIGALWLGGAVYMLWPPLLAVVIWVGVISSTINERRRPERV